MDIFIVISIVTITAGICLYKKNINIVKEWAHEFVITAEQTILGTAQGRKKMHYVISRIYELLPWYLKIIFTKRLLENIVQQCFDIVKDSFDDTI